MPTTLASDFKVYQAEFQTGVWEGVMQFVQAFNVASRNAIVLVQRDLKGDYAKNAFFKDIASLISRRDTTSVAAATSLKGTQGEEISVKVSRKVGPVDYAIDAIAKIGMTDQELSFALGVLVGQKKAQDMLNTGVLSAEAALEGQAAVNFDATGLATKTLITSHLVSGLAKFGDMAESIVAWVMHSKSFFDLIGSQITDKIFNVTDRVIYGALPASLNRPIIVTDAPALHDDNDSATDTYNVLGLTANGLVVTESEGPDRMVTEIVTGLEQLVFRLQGEFAYNIGMKGFQWDTANGGKNPTDAALATTTNWDKAVTDDKSLAGIRIKVQ